MTIKNYSKQCLMISAGIMVLALLLSLFGMGINVGIDFSGGMSMQYTMGEAVTQSDIEGVLNGIGLKDYAVSVQGTGKDSTNIRIKVSISGYISGTFTPKGLSVAASHLRICSRSTSGCMEPAPINPNPPALLTAEASRQPLHQTIPACMMGY